MDYNKPSKEDANATYLRSIGYTPGNAYNEESIEKKKTFLIICEGENTEPLYFEGFPVPSKAVITMGGKNTKNKLVEFALEQQKKPEHKDREIWCVFDMDIKPDEGATQPADFNSAIIRAEAAGLQVAWSNDAFELWFILHYQDLTAALTRHELYPILKEKWKLDSFHKTAKTENYCMEHYDRHLADGAVQELAIRRARNLHKRHEGARNYADQCPCTTVYKLVEELNKNIE